ncbi:hypothetical protein E4U19_003987 [Claviceps sp. Clav32 group G5]|nr:hypothetical protein E4U19_003987 [Claviceps sp. Clav32 group G5]
MSCGKVRSPTEKAKTFVSLISDHAAMPLSVSDLKRASKIKTSNAILFDELLRNSTTIASHESYSLNGAVVISFCHIVGM